MTSRNVPGPNASSVAFTCVLMCRWSFTTPSTIRARAGSRVCSICERHFFASMPRARISAKITAHRNSFGEVMSSRYPRGLLLRALLDGDEDSTRSLLRGLTECVRRDFMAVSISMFEAQVAHELRRDDQTRMLAMCLKVLGVDPAVTSAERKLEICRAVEDREWVFVRSFLKTLPSIVNRHLRSEPNHGEFVLEAKSEMCICAPLSAIITPPRRSLPHAAAARE